MYSHILLRLNLFLAVSILVLTILSHILKYTTTLQNITTRKLYTIVNITMMHIKIHENVKIAYLVRMRYYPVYNHQYSDLVKE